MQLEIKNGKFYKGDVEIPPEFGNLEQIALIKKLVKEAELEETKLSVEGKVISEEVSTYYPVIVFQCPKCHSNNNIEFEDKVFDCEIDNNDVKGWDVTCKCGLDFIVEEGTGYNKIILKYNV